MRLGFISVLGLLALVLLWSVLDDVGVTRHQIAQPPHPAPPAEPAPVPESDPEPASAPSPPADAGVIGVENRVPVGAFAPDRPGDFPGWRAALGAGVMLNCGAGPIGSGVVIGQGGLVLTAAHNVLRPQGGQFFRDGQSCAWVHADGGRRSSVGAPVVQGAFDVPAALATHFSVAVSEQDWAVLRLERPFARVKPLPLARRDTLDLRPGTPVLSVGGPQDNHAHKGMLAQQCRYIGPPPSASALDQEGAVYGRPFEQGDEFRVARFDCDIGRGGSGSPIIGWSRGRPVLWGIVTDSLRGREVCVAPGRTFCYNAGPLVTAMDLQAVLGD